MPTYNKDYRLDPSYRMYLLQQEIYSAKPQSIIHNAFYYKGLNVDGTCDGWNEFVYDRLTVPMKGLEFDTLNIFFESRDFAIDSWRNQTNECKDKKVVQAIVHSFVYGATYEGNCDGVTWRVFWCNGNPVFCVNCKRNCVKTVACPGQSWVVNPCYSCNNHAIGASVVRFGFSVTSPFPEIAEIFISNVDRTTVNITMNVTSVGNIYCRAFGMKVALKSVAQIAYRTSPVLIEEPGYMSVLVTGLNPDSPYKIYCFTEDFGRNVMSLEKSLRTEQNITTACCRQLIFDKTYTSVNQYIVGSVSASKPESVFEIRLDSQPTENVRLRLAIVPIMCPATKLYPVDKVDLVAIPPGFDFFGNSTILTGKFVIRGTATGCYALRATTKGRNFYAGANTTFVLRNIRVPPELPILTSVTYTDDGLGILWNFDSETDKASSKIITYATQFNCSQIVQFPGSTQATCKWGNTSQLISTLNANADSVPNIGETMLLRGGRVRAACVAGTTCSSYAYVSPSTMKLDYAVNPIPPTSLLYTPATVSACSDITLDPTASTGYGIKPWSAVLWSVGGTAHPDNCTTIGRYLNSNYKTTTKFPVVPNKYLIPGKQYVFTLKVVNWFGQSSAGLATVNVATITTVPEAKVYTSKPVFYASETVTVVAAAKIATCADAPSNISLTYDWKVYLGPVLISIKSISLDPRYFRVAPYTFSAATVYTIRATVGIPGTKTFTRTDLSLKIGEQGVLAVISGSDTKRVSISNDLTLDASSSYDQDDLSATLSYSWSCLSLTSYGNPCPGFPTSGLSDSTLSISKNKMAVGSYSISVQVMNGKGTIDIASATIYYVAKEVPTIVLPTITSKYNPDSRIVIDATVTSTNKNKTLTASWTCDRISSLRTVVTTSATRTFSIGVNSFPVVIPANTFVGGITYTFTLKAQFSGISDYAESSISIIMNSPPTGGNLIITPSSGNALSTVFTMNSYFWIDEDLPLTYLYSYKTIDTSDSLQSILRNKDIVPYYSCVLGQGLLSENYYITVLAFVFDVYDGVVNSTLPIRVNPIKTISFAIQLVSSSLSNPSTDSDPNAIALTLNAGLNSVNTVDCTVPSPCEQLNRKPCSTVTRTCGECYPGYFGASGPANSPCNISMTLKANGQDCTKNSTCLSGYCKRTCEGGNCKTLCQDVSKKCPGDCLNRGRCVFYNMFNEVLPSCSFMNPMCTAKCSCFANRYGQDCSLTTAGLQEMKSFREIVCINLLKLVSRQDISTDVIQSRAQTVISNFADANQISLNALGNCTAALTSSVNKKPSLACGTETVSLLMKAYSSMLSLGNGLPTYALESIDDAIDSLLKNCQSNVVVGDSPMEILQDNLRIASTAVTASDLAQSTFSSPQSGNEKFLGVSPPTEMKLATSDSSSSGNVVVTMKLYTNNPKGSVVNSSAVVIQAGKLKASKVSAMSFKRRLMHESDEEVVDVGHDFVGVMSYADSETLYPIDTAQVEEVVDDRLLSVSANSIIYEVTLQNTAPMEYDLLLPTKYSLRCPDLRPQPYTRNITCPAGEFINYDCPANRRGTYNITCPGYSKRPKCTSWNGYAFQIDENCEAITYTATNTTCRCTYSSSALRERHRYLQSVAPSTSTLEFATIMLIDRTDKIIDIELDPPFLEVEISTSAITTCYLLVVIVYGGTFLFGFVDYFTAGGTFLSKKKQLDAKVEEAVATGTKLNLDELKQTYVQKAWVFFTGGNNEAKYKKKKKKKVKHAPSRTIQSFFEKIYPEEFREGRWYYVLFVQLLQHHSWLTLINPYVPGASLSPFPGSGGASTGTGGIKSLKFRSLRWFYAVTKILAFAFLSTLMVWNVASDDGFCVQFDDDEQGCNRPTTAFGYLKACEWRPENLSCIYRKPENSFLLILVCVFIVLLFGSIIEGFIHFCEQLMLTLFYQYKHGMFSYYSPMADTPGHVSANDDFLGDRAIPRVDEFAYIQTFKAKIFQAARLEKQRRCMDYVIPHEEAADLVMNRNKKNKHWSNQQVFKYAVQKAFFDKLRYNFPEKDNEQVSTWITRTRLYSVRLHGMLESIISLEEREEYLMKQFILDLFQGNEQVILRQYLFVGSTYMTYFRAFLYSPVWRSFACGVMMILWNILVIVMFAVLYSIGTDIGTRAASLWYHIFLITLVQDIFVIEPLAIWMQFVVVNGKIRKEVNDVYQSLIDRSRLVLRRSFGLMKHADDFVQHLNPACRVARNIPHWPIARLLLCLSDYDLPVRPLREGRSYWYHQFITGIGRLILLPGMLGRSILLALMIVLFNALVIVLYFISVSPYPELTLLVIGALVAAYLYLEFRYQWKQFVIRKKEERIANARIFEEVDSKLIVGTNGEVVDTETSEWKSTNQMTLNKAHQQAASVQKKLRTLHECKNKIDKPTTTHAWDSSFLQMIDEEVDENVTQEQAELEALEREGVDGEDDENDDDMDNDEKESEDQLMNLGYRPRTVSREKKSRSQSRSRRLRAAIGSDYRGNTQELIEDVLPFVESLPSVTVLDGSSSSKKKLFSTAMRPGVKESPPQQIRKISSIVDKNAHQSLYLNGGSQKFIPGPLPSTPSSLLLAPSSSAVYVDGSKPPPRDSPPDSRLRTPSSRGGEFGKQMPTTTPSGVELDLARSYQGDEFSQTRMSIGGGSVAGSMMSKSMASAARDPYLHMPASRDDFSVLTSPSFQSRPLTPESLITMQGPNSAGSRGGDPLDQSLSFPLVDGAPLPANNMRVIGDPIPFDSSTTTRTASMQASPSPSRPRTQQKPPGSSGLLPWNSQANQFGALGGLHFDDSSVAWEQMRPINDDSSIESTPSFLINNVNRKQLRQQDPSPSRPRHPSQNEPTQRLRYNLALNAGFDNGFDGSGAFPPSADSFTGSPSRPPHPGQDGGRIIPNPSTYSPDAFQRAMSSQGSVRSIVSETKSVATVKPNVGSRTRARRISKSYLDINYTGSSGVSSVRDDDAQSYDNHSHLSELSSIVTADHSASSQYQYRKYAGRRRNRLKLQGRSSTDDQDVSKSDRAAGPGGKSISEIVDNNERLRQSHELLHWRTDKPLPDVDIFSGGNSVFSTRESVYSASVAAASSTESIGSGASPVRKKAFHGPGSILYSEENDDDPLRVATFGKKSSNNSVTESLGSVAPSGHPMFTWT